MDIIDVGLFKLADRRLAWAEQRQALLAQNVANANTPGFEGKDLAPFSATMSNAAMTLTSPQHLTGRSAGVESRPGVIKSRSPNGNAVALEEQLVQVADTAAAQELTLGLYRRYQSMFRIAVGRGG